MAAIGMVASALHAQFHVKRNPKHYELNIIIPSILYYVLVWCGLWVDPAVAPARVVLCVIPTLIMANMYLSVMSKLPPVPYTTWMSDYLLGLSCIFSIHLLQYAMLNWSNRRVKERKAAREQQRAEIMGKHVKIAPAPLAPDQRPTMIGNDADKSDVAKADDGDACVVEGDPSVPAGTSPLESSASPLHNEPDVLDRTAQWNAKHLDYVTRFVSIVSMVLYISIFYGTIDSW